MKYDLLNKQIQVLITNEKDMIANLANISSLLMMEIKDINWVGFYFAKDDELVLGPFQGKVACTRIKKGMGVCGKSYNDNKAIIVPNVHEFVGHIACDFESNSEIVLPIHKDNKVFALLDIDSKSFNRFNNNDLKELSLIIDSIEKTLF